MFLFKSSEKKKKKPRSSFYFNRLINGFNLLISIPFHLIFRIINDACTRKGREDGTFRTFSSFFLPLDVQHPSNVSLPCFCCSRGSVASEAATRRVSCRETCPGFSIPRFSPFSTKRMRATRMTRRRLVPWRKGRSRAWYFSRNPGLGRGKERSPLSRINYLLGIGRGER